MVVDRELLEALRDQVAKANALLDASKALPESLEKDIAVRTAEREAHNAYLEYGEALDSFTQAGY